MIGHSLGGNLLATGVKDSMIGIVARHLDVLQKNRDASKADHRAPLVKPPFGDLIVLLKSSFRSREVDCPAARLLATPERGGQFQGRPRSLLGIPATDLYVVDGSPLLRPQTAFTAPM